MAGGGLWKHTKRLRKTKKKKKESADEDYMGLKRNVRQSLPRFLRVRVGEEWRRRGKGMRELSGVKTCRRNIGSMVRSPFVGGGNDRA